MAAPRKKKGRKPRDGEASRLALLDAAQKEFAAKGFAGARLSAIASAARLEPGLIHFHFTDKEGLYSAMLVRAFGRLQEDVRALLDGLASALAATSPSERRALDPASMRFLGEALVGLTQSFYTEHGQIIALLRQEAARGSALAKQLAAKHIRPVFEQVIARIEELKEEGIVAPDVDARHLFASVVAMTAYPLLDPLFVETIWPDGPRGATFDADRRAEIVATALARMLGGSGRHERL
jgi:AcrR family transcriptional regulator